MASPPGTFAVLVQLNHRTLSRAIAGQPVCSGRTTVIADYHRERDLAGEIGAYDRRRAALRPYRRQRNVERWGNAQLHGWSEDKFGNTPSQRTDFGRFIRRKGFCLD